MSDTFKIKLLYKHLKPVKWYQELYDNITKKHAQEYRDHVMNSTHSPKPERLDEIKQLLLKKDSTVTDQTVWEAHHSLIAIASIAISQGYVHMRKRERAKKIREWRNKDRAKDQRLLNTNPLKNIRCPVCNELMEYEASELYDKGTWKKPDEVVMFFYECPNKCKRKLIFEDGTPWISKEKNICAVCSSKQKIIVTKTSTNETYLIKECEGCQSKEVEKF